jgi:hypothetical protein
MKYLILCPHYVDGMRYVLTKSGFSKDEVVLLYDEHSLTKIHEYEFDGIIIVPGFFENEFAHQLYQAGITRLRGR